MDDLHGQSRRRFLGTMALGATSLGVSRGRGAVGDAAATSESSRGRFVMKSLPDLPTNVWIQHDDARLVGTQREDNRFSSPQATVTFDGARIKIACPSGPLSRVVVRWKTRFPSEVLVLGDHWERGYGDLQWRSLQPERVLPWYLAVHYTASGQTFFAGVETQPAAMCFWTLDAEGLSLWLDFRNGGSPSIPGDREIVAASLVSGISSADESPFAALRRFCRAMCRYPRLAPAPICGNNNWYYAYGHDFDADAMRRDAAFLAEIAGDHRTRPFCVIDAGWSPGSVCPGGLWTAGDGKRFPDMPGLAADIKRAGVRPGIWIRPSALTVVDSPRRLRAGPANSEEKPLDLTLAENLDQAREDIARVRSWGYELIKHDFSTFDIFGKWGFEMGAELTESGWNFADRSLTNAEIILRYYRALRDGAKDAVLLGCNTIGHLGAGLFEIQRAGDDTSGRVWERTRRMGVNTLAYRLCQHGTFFAVDADCAAHTKDTPWEMDSQFLDLVARSGTALFVSVDPRTITENKKKAFTSAMRMALSGGEPGGCEPLDWLHTTTPREWRFGLERASYAWEEPTGAWPLRV